MIKIIKFISSYSIRLGAMFYLINFNPTHIISQNVSAIGMYVDLGLGHANGGYGLKASIRYNHLYLYGNYGYVPPKKTKIVTVPESFNTGFGINYSFSQKYFKWTPIVGLHYGWLNNYYNEKIGTSNYNPNLNGLSLFGGYQYFGKFIKIDLGIHAYSKYTISQISKHPFYDEGNTIHFSPQVSIGLSIDNTIKETFKTYFKNRTKSNKIEQNYKGHELNEKNTKRNSKRELKKIYNNTIESNCIKTPYSDISIALKKGICSNLFVYQFIFGKQVLYAHIDLDSINIYPGCNQYFLENNPENIIIAIADSSNYSEDYCCKMANLYSNFIEDVADSVYFGVKGKITIAALRKPNTKNEIYQITLKFSELKCVRNFNNMYEEIYFDELIIWDAESVENCK